MPPETTTVQQPAQQTMAKVGSTGFSVSDDTPIVSGGDGSEGVTIPTINKPAPAAKKAASDGEGGKSEQQPPVKKDARQQAQQQQDTGPSEAMSDDELLEFAARAAGKGKKRKEKDAADVSGDKKAGEGEGDQPELPEKKPGEGQEQQPQPTSSKETNLANLRKLLDTASKERDELRAEVEQLRELKGKADSFSQWEKEKAALNEQVQKLSPFRDLFAIHENPVFHQAFIKPVEDAKADLSKLAKDYAASDDDVADLLQSNGNKRELNEKLAEMFGDADLAIDEARSLIGRIQSVEAKRIEAEKKPAETLKELQAAQQQADAEFAKKKVELATTNAAEGWGIATAINTDPKFEVAALVEIPGNKEHNDRRVQIMKDAQALHIQGINIILKHGGSISRQLASYLAAQAQLATVAGVYQREAAYYQQEYEKLAKKMGVTREMERPGATTAPRTSAEKKQSQKMSGRQAAKEAWNQVMAEGSD